MYPHQNDGSVSLVTVGLEAGPMFFPGGIPVYDEKENLLIITFDDMEDGHVTFNFDRVVFWATSRVSPEEIQAAIDSESDEG